MQLLSCSEQDEQNSDQEVSESSQSEEHTVGLEDEESSDSEPGPPPVVKHRVAPLYTKGHYSLCDCIVAPQRFQ